MIFKENKSKVFHNGSRWKTTKSGEFEIIGKEKDRYLCRFDDGYTIISDSKEIRNGKILNPNVNNKKNGLATIGIGEYDSTNMFYRRWEAMLNRCYSEDENHYRVYKDVKICEEWHNFQNFVKFCLDTYPTHIEDVKFSLDKDILNIENESKIYSPSTCCWLPTSINAFLTNNQPKHNTSGYTGVSINRYGTWRAQINDFETGKYIVIKWNCETKEEAYELYKEYRAKNAEKVKDYLRSLNYLPEEIIQLIK
jgi:hypothetical protein